MLVVLFVALPECVLLALWKPFEPLESRAGNGDSSVDQGILEVPWFSRSYCHSLLTRRLLSFSFRARGGLLVWVTGSEAKGCFQRVLKAYFTGYPALEVYGAKEESRGAARGRSAACTGATRGLLPTPRRHRGSKCLGDGCVLGTLRLRSAPTLVGHYMLCRDRELPSDNERSQAHLRNVVGFWLLGESSSQGACRATRLSTHTSSGTGLIKQSSVCHHDRRRQRSVSLPPPTPASQPSSRSPRGFALHHQISAKGGWASYTWRTSARLGRQDGSTILVSASAREACCSKQCRYSYECSDRALCGAGSSKLRTVRGCCCRRR
jgi:hypothetical protein